MMGIVYAKPEAAGALRPAGQSQRMFVSVDEIRVEPFFPDFASIPPLEYGFVDHQRSRSEVVAARY